VAELNRLEKQCDKAREKVATAERQLEKLKEDRADAVVRAKLIWGDSAIRFPVQKAYSFLHEIDAAMADFPEVRKALLKQVAEAEAKLTAFKNANEL
jgi:cell division FtsZ-interacting protein ZapD